MFLFLAVLKILFPVFFLGLVGFIWSKLKLDYPVKFVTSLTIDSMTIESSAPFTGKVHIQVFKAN